MESVACQSAPPTHANGSTCHILTVAQGNRYDLVQWFLMLATQLSEEIPMTEDRKEERKNRRTKRAIQLDCWIATQLFVIHYTISPINWIFLQKHFFKQNSWTYSPFSKQQHKRLHMAYSSTLFHWSRSTLISTVISCTDECFVVAFSEK